MKTRLISFLLLIALVVTAMPLVSFATENEESTPNTDVESTMTEAQYNALYVQDELKAAFDVMVLNEYWGLAVDHKLDTNGNPIKFPKSPMDDDYPHTGVYDYQPVKNGDIHKIDFSKCDFQKLYVADDKDTPDDSDDITYPYYVDRFDSTARDAKGNITAEAPYYIMQGERKADTTAEYTASALYIEGEATEAQQYENLADANEKVKDLEKTDTADTYDYWIVSSDKSTAAEDYHIMTCTRDANSLTGYSAFTKGAESYASIAAANRKIAELEAADTKNTKDYWIVGDDTSLAYQAALKYYDGEVDAWLAAYTWKGPFLASGTNYPNTNYSLRNNNSFAYLATVADPVAGQGYLVRQYYTCSSTGLSFASAFPYSKPANPLPAGSAATLEAVTRIVNTPSNEFLYMLNVRPRVKDGKIVGIYNAAGFTVSSEEVGDAAIDTSSTKTFRISLSNSEEENADKVVFEQGNTTLYSAVGTYPNNETSCLIGYQNSFKNGRIYALRIYNKTLDEDEKAQNHFADIAKWFKLDVAGFYAVRDNCTPKALETYYDAFAALTIDSTTQADAQAVANSAYETLTANIYPSLTLDDYNELYVQTDLITAFDVMAFNKFWGKAVNDNAENVDFPTSPMYDENYKGTYVDYNGTSTGGEYPEKETWDFTEKAKITYEGQENVEIPYYKDRFDPRARDTSGNIVANPKEGKEYEYHIMQGNRGNGANGFTGFSAHTAIIADNNTYYSLEAAYEACLAKEAADKTDRYEYWIVGDDTSEAYQKAIDTYKEDTDKWYAQYIWRGSKKYEGSKNPDVYSVPAYGNEYYKYRLAWSFARYDFAADPTPGTGYLLSQYPYIGGAGLYYNPGTALTAKETVTLETVINVPTLSKEFIILHNQRPTISDSKFVVGSGFVAKATTVQKFTTDFVLNKAETFRFVVSKDITVVEGEAATDRVILEQGAKTFYDATGTYTYSKNNMIGFDNSVKGSKIYALRVYRTDLTPAQKNQNHFADIAKWYRLDIAELEKYNDTVKQYVYKAFADYTVDTETETRTSMQAVFDTALEEIVLLQFDKVLEFEGYRAKLQTMPGLRSTYSISKEAIEILEASDRKVIVGAMIAYANEERNSHDKLVAPTNGNEYDREGYKAEYKYIDGGVAYQEIYHTGEKKGEIDGVVGSILSEKEGTTDKEYKFAFTTTYGDGQQTVANFEQELLYRGFVVIQDAEGYTEEILYTDMTSSYFGNSISIYELCKHFEEYEGVEEVDVDGKYSEYLKSAQIIKPLDTVENAPAKLYVTDGLLYNVNFDSATSDMTINGNTNGTYAHEKFNGTADDFARFVIAKKDGISPLSGGTAPILAGGGWQFITPYRYSYWFDDNGNQIRFGADTGTFNNFVTAKGDESFFTSVPKIDVKGNEIEGSSEAVTYLTDGNNNPLVADTNRTIGDVTKSIYTLIHTAPSGVAANYYMTPGVWTRKACTSEFGDKYFDAGSGTQVSIYTGGALDDIKSAGKLTVELTVASEDLEEASFFIGPRFKFVPYEDHISFTATEGAELLASESGYEDIQMNLNGREINTYSLTFDMNNNGDPDNVIDITTNNKYILKAYGNGTQEIVTYGADQVLLSETNYFHAKDQYIMDGYGIRNYAIRVYAKVLSADEISQNHFADIAVYNDLDLGEFRKLTDTQKLYVYNAFAGVAIDDKTVTVGEAELTLQQLLDKAVADAQTAE